MAVLIDFENVSNAKHAAMALEVGSRRGVVVAKKAFGDWTGSIENGQTELTKLGIELVHQMGIGKGNNGCDMRLVIEAMDLLHDMKRAIDIFVLATSDVDFVPLAVRLMSAGKTVIGAGRPEVTSDLFKMTVDEFVPIGSGAIEVGTARSANPQTGTSAKGFGSSERPRPALRPKPNPVHGGNGTSRRLDSDTRLLIMNAMFDVSQRNDGLVKGSPLHESMKAIDPNFDFRKLGFETFADLLDLDENLEVRGRGQAGDITVWIKGS